MSQFTPTYPSQDSNSSNTTQYMPNTGMYTGQFPWPQPANIPHPGFYNPYGVPPHGAAPPYAPVASSPDVGAGVAHHAFQAGQNVYYPPAVAGVANVNPHQPLTESAPPPQYPSVPPLYHQPFPSNAFPGAVNPYAPPAPYQGYIHQHHGSELPAAFSHTFVSEAPGFVAKEHNSKRIQRWIDKIKNDPLFKPVLDPYGQHDGTYMCSNDGMVIRPASYTHHIITAKHLGYKLMRFKCPLCQESYTRRDACKRHWNDNCGKIPVDGVLLSFRDACQYFKNSASASPVEAPTAASTSSLPIFAMAQTNSSFPETTPTEAIEDAPNPGALVTPELPTPEVQETSLEEFHDFLAEFLAASEIEDVPMLPPSEVPEAKLAEVMLTEVHDPLTVNEIQDPAFVVPVLPPPEVREITFAEVHGDIDFWRWINDLEDTVDPILDPPSSPSPESYEPTISL